MSISKNQIAEILLSVNKNFSQTMEHYYNLKYSLVFTNKSIRELVDSLPKYFDEKTSNEIKTIFINLLTNLMDFKANKDLLNSIIHQLEVKVL